MDRNDQQEEPETSWSENTTPASDDLGDFDDAEEVVREPLPVQRMNGVGEVPYFIQTNQHRIHAQPYHPLSVTTKCQQSYSFSILDSRRSMEGSETSQSSATSPLTALTSTASSFTDPWGSSGLVEDEEIWNHDQDLLLVPKLEPEEEDVDMADVKEASMSGSISASTTPVTIKRPRGRPRKHPKISLEDKAKIAKARSKTGCITCRRRKKKCDERKPGCNNCEKNRVTCEGYAPKTLWKSGKERAQEAQGRRLSYSVITPVLDSIIPGVTTAGDRLFLEHYCFRLSNIFTVDGTQDNAFTSILLPMAVHNPPLMHSLLTMSSKHVDFDTPYGAQLLKSHPDVTMAEIAERTQYHHDEALKELPPSSDPSEHAPMVLGQALCRVLETLADENPTGRHRLHLNCYRQIMKDFPQDDSEYQRFIDEFFRYHICADEIICLPQFRVAIDSDDWELPSSIVEPTAVRLLGVFDGLFLYMSKITNLRNRIREKMQKGKKAVVLMPDTYNAARIDASIRAWTPVWPEDDSRTLAGNLYRQMLHVYLWRTVFPPSPSDWKIDERLVKAVDVGIEMLETFDPKDSSQTLLLAPTFVMGCAAFQESQRVSIRKAIATVKSYVAYKNSDTALLVLEKVWQLMDAHDTQSWDWQTIAFNMGLDFLAT